MHKHELQRGMPSGGTGVPSTGPQRPGPAALQPPQNNQNTITHTFTLSISAESDIARIVKADCKALQLKFQSRTKDEVIKIQDQPSSDGSV